MSLLDQLISPKQFDRLLDKSVLEMELENAQVRIAELESVLKTLRNHTSVSINQIEMIDAVLGKEGV